jgi:hypothetical protein
LTGGFGLVDNYNKEHSQEVYKQGIVDIFNL